MSKGASPLYLLNPDGKVFDWANDAACSDIDKSLFFSYYAPEIHEAKAICGSCPVREECLAFSLRPDLNNFYGVWGGKDEVERKSLRWGKPFVTRICVGCDYEFSSQRDSQTTCSPKCRYRAIAQAAELKRQQKASPDDFPPS